MCKNGNYLVNSSKPGAFQHRVLFCFLQALKQSSTNGFCVWECSFIAVVKKLIVGLARAVSVDYNCLCLGYRNFSVLFFENGLSITLLEKGFCLLCSITDVIKYVIETQLNKSNPVDSPSEILFCIFRERNQLKPICILKAIMLKANC